VPEESAGRDGVRLGTYWQRATHDRARSAYVVDLDHLEEAPPSGFARWIERAITRHNTRTPAERAQLADHLAPEDKSAGRVNRAVVLPSAVIEGAEQAIVADRREVGRVASLSAYITVAVRVAADEAATRYGRPLPPPPARLPNRPTR